MRNHGRNDSRYHNHVTEHEWQEWLLEDTRPPRNLEELFLYLVKLGVWMFRAAVALFLLYFMFLEVMEYGI